MTKTRIASATLCAVGALLAGLPAAAQTASTGAELEAIVVTANRRSEALQDVPVAVSAFTEDAVKQLGISDPRSLANLVPGFQANRIGIFPATFLRGIGTTSSGPTIETAVATYIDDVYMPSSASAAMANYNSISRMEVLKGPQGTLFGRNATGGVVQVFTKNPDLTAPKLDLSAGYANYDTRSASLYGSTPLGDNFAANVALYASDQKDGWGRNILTGADVNLGLNVGGRVKLLWEPSDATSALLTLDYDMMKSDFATVNRVAPGTRAVLGQVSAPGFYDSNLNDPSYNKNIQKGASLKVSHDLGVASLVSISAYRKNYGEIYYDNDYGPLPFIGAHLLMPQRTYTQELQLLSSAESRVDWIVGAYYFDDKGGYSPLQIYGSILPAALRYTSAYTSQHTKSVSGFGQVAAEVFPRLRVTLGARYTSDKRELTVGSIIATAAGPVPAAPTPVANSPQSKTWSKLTGRIGVDYKLTDDAMVYAQFNRGFRSGLFNTNVSAGAPIGAPVQPEVLDAFTAGFKTEFLDNRLRLNAEAFHYTYKNLQLQQTTGVTTIIVNAAKATYKGIDIDLTAKPAPNFTIVGALEVMKGRYDSYPNGLFNVYQAAGGNCTFTVVPAPGAVPCGNRALPPNYNPVTGTWDLKGNHTVHTPPVSFTLTGQYLLETAAGPFNMNLSWSYKGRYYADADNGLGQAAPSYRDADRQKAIHLLRGSVTWTSPSERYEVRLWGENLTNEKYWAFAIENSQGTRNNVAAPRTYGVTLSLHM